MKTIKMVSKKQILNNLKLVNYKKHRGHDGDGFNAEIIYDGKKIAHVQDDAWGGEFSYTILGKLDSKERVTNLELFNNLESDINNLPPRFNEELKLEFKYNLDIIISDKCQELDLRKDERKGVLVKQNYGWQIYGFKTSLSATIAKWDDGLEAIQKIYDEHNKKGETILNKAYLKSLGIKL